MQEELALLYDWLVEQQPKYQLTSLCTETAVRGTSPHFLLVTGKNFGGGASRRLSRELYALLYDDYPESGTYAQVLEYINHLHRKCALDELIEEL